MTHSPPLFELNNVGKAFQERPVLRGVDLALPLTENLLITGPSGSGKSTLLRLIAGLESPTTGEVYVGGQLAARGQSTFLPPGGRGIAMVFQDLGLWPNLTALGNVLLGLSGLRIPRRERRDRARAALADCHVEAVSQAYPHRLSVGEQQRVALARAMAVRPQLLLLDEPFTALDLVMKDLLLDQLAHLSDQSKTRVCLVSHFPPDATDLNARLVFRNSFYWSKKAMREAPDDLGSAVNYRWYTDKDYLITPILEAVKEPLEERVWFNYPDQIGGTYPYYAGQGGIPVKTLRLLSDGTSGLLQTYYNPLGKLTNYVDPIGRSLVLAYASNQVDLMSIRQSTGGTDYGRICKSFLTDRYYYTYKSYGQSKAHSDPGGCGLFDKPAGAWHTHGGNDPGYDNENFSPEDKDYATRRDQPTYLGTPSGNVKKFNPTAAGPGGPQETTMGSGAK